MNKIKAIETRYNGYRFRSRLEARWCVFFDKMGIQYMYEPEGFELMDGTWYLPDFEIFPPFPTEGWEKSYYLEIKPVKPSNEEIEKSGLLAYQSGKSVGILYGNPWQGEYSIMFLTSAELSREAKEIMDLICSKHWGSQQRFMLGVVHNYFNSGYYMEEYKDRLRECFDRFDNRLLGFVDKDKRETKPYRVLNNEYFWVVCEHCERVFDGCYDSIMETEQCKCCGSHSGRSYEVSRVLFPIRCTYCEELEDKFDSRFSPDHPKLLEAFKAARSARFEHGQTPELA